MELKNSVLFSALPRYIAYAFLVSSLFKSCLCGSPLSHPHFSCLSHLAFLLSVWWCLHLSSEGVFQGAAHRRDPLLSTGFRSELQTPPLFTHEKARHRPPIPILCLKNDWLNCWSPLTNLDKTSANVTSFTRFSESRQPLKLSSGTGTMGKAVLMESTDLRAKHCLIPSDHGLLFRPPIPGAF